MKIDQAQEPDYEVAKITYIGFVDPYAVEGMLVLSADNGKEFHMRAFSGEVSRYISNFQIIYMAGYFRGMLDHFQYHVLLGSFHFLLHS